MRGICRVISRLTGGPEQTVPLAPILKHRWVILDIVGIGEKRHGMAVRLAFSWSRPDIGGGRLAADVSLANRVRSGRKQP